MARAKHGERRSVWRTGPRVAKVLPVLQRVLVIDTGSTLIEGRKEEEEAEEVRKWEGRRRGEGRGGGGRGPGGGGGSCGAGVRGTRG